MSVHFRFGWYVFCMTSVLAGAIYCFNHDVKYVLPIYFILPSMRKILGPGFQGWHETHREVSNRALVIGFIICLAAVWVGGLMLAHYLFQTNHVSKYITWFVVAVVWALLVFPAYQWWRAQKNEAGARSLVI